MFIINTTSIMKNFLINLGMTLTAYIMPLLSLKTLEYLQGLIFFLLLKNV